MPLFCDTKCSVLSSGFSATRSARSGCVLWPTVGNGAHRQSVSRRTRGGRIGIDVPPIVKCLKE